MPFTDWAKIICVQSGVINTIFQTHEISLDNAIGNFKKSTNSLLNWFSENHMKANADKCHLLMTSDESCTTRIEDFSIKNSTEEKLLGVKLDSNLSIENHVTSLC